MILVVFWCNRLNAQTSDYIEGKVINGYTSEPIPFACILLIKNKLGIYANAEGDFRISQKTQLRSDSLLLTCIGYKSLSISLASLNVNEVNIIPLIPLAHIFDDVTVVAHSKILGSTTIISRAIKNIRKNFPETSYSYISYYRDYQKSEKEYFNLNEAIVQTLDNGFKTSSKANMYRLLDYKKNTNLTRLNISPYYDTIGQFNKTIPKARLGDQYGNELFVLMVHDAIRNYNARSFSFINIFSKDFLDNHDFSKPELTFSNDVKLYKIQFTAKHFILGDSLSANGTIFIQPSDYSIHKLEYACQYLKPPKVKKDIFHITIEYGYESAINKIMHLKYISFNNSFSITDQDDTTYFRIKDSKWNSQSVSSVIILTFNKLIDSKTALNKDNYTILTGNKKAEIKNIVVNRAMLFITLKGSNLKLSSASITLKNLKDINGNILNKKKEIEFNQFRELFVQEYNRKLAFRDSCFMEQLPIEDNCISHESVPGKYWMNTPKYFTIK